MNGLHDLGGMQGFGPLQIEADEPPFHCEAERRMFGMMMGLLTAGLCDPDGFRYQVEQLSPQDYLREVFHDNWLKAVEAQLLERGVLRRGELDAWMAGAPVDVRPVPPASQPPDGAPLPARFTAGDRVRARQINPAGHTRLPRFARGVCGVVERDHGVFRFSDTLASRQGGRPQHLYLVRFDAAALWGEVDRPRAGDWVSLDLFDDYLEPAA